MLDEKQFRECAKEISHTIYKYCGKDNINDFMDFICLYHATSIASSLREDLNERDVEQALVTSSRMLYLSAKEFYEIFRKLKEDE